MSAPRAPRPRIAIPQDLWLAAGLAALAVLGSAVALKDDFWTAVPGFEEPLAPAPLELFLLLAGTLPLAFRRVAPISVLVLCVAASLSLQTLGRPTLLPLGVLVALYSLAVLRRPLACGVAVMGYLIALLAGTVTGRAPLSDDLFFNYLVVVAGAVMLGYGVALGRARASLAEQRAAELAREQEGLTRTAVKEEQARIAREVHDIVAHDVSVIVAQAAVARRLVPAEPQTAVQALASIEAVGRDALDSLRRLLGLLRTERGGCERTPQPGLDNLPSLLAQVRSAGLPVEFVVRGSARPLPATVELHAYRIVQEALTNSLKHAGPTRTTVTLDYQGDSLDIEISDQGRLPQAHSDARRYDPWRSDEWRNEDDGARAGQAEHGWAAPESSAGYGLIGMQQRVAMLGGELAAGSKPERGFRVAARLPVAGGTP
jgi:signal transduction histidine kinase